MLPHDVIALTAKKSSMEKFLAEDSMFVDLKVGVSTYIIADNSVAANNAFLFIN